MGLTRAIGTAVVLAGAVATGLAVMPQAAHAGEIEDLITPGSIAPVQLLGDGKVMTADQATVLLESEGFVIIEKERTLLGRIRIVAESPQGQREIVLHAGDGRVMRDLFTESERPAAVIRPAEPLVPVVPSQPLEIAVSEPPVPDQAPPEEPPTTEPPTTEPPTTEPPMPEPPMAEQTEPVVTPQDQQDTTGVTP